MNRLTEVENVSGLFQIRKVKTLWYLGYGENIVYIINRDTGKVRWKEIENGSNRRRTKSNTKKQKRK